MTVRRFPTSAVVVAYNYTWLTTGRDGRERQTRTTYAPEAERGERVNLGFTLTFEEAARVLVAVRPDEGPEADK